MKAHQKIYLGSLVFLLILNALVIYKMNVQPVLLTKSDRLEIEKVIQTNYQAVNAGNVDQYLETIYPTKRSTTKETMATSIREGRFSSN
ncbi:hypothetical protein FC15_GL001764 [Lapidilactobacillus concavus DSM 17758]|uniref:Uncharacterized protein n=1 Tax=Lapidilactobacillus concavus DSM 17758 TaxID=1423735 RepID=A0A0R1VTS6_9LACO|nr:hypothetical protein [Lapidilactobacillus concavus]KRM09114.1 hypothetical protein FC15_GL001764 [Lapidilactobacillus concavus DSM 17758]GEL13740.1 hypothetical protein LCO01nite_12890 [Lapidilactobacillus concavus]